LSLLIPNFTGTKNLLDPAVNNRFEGIVIYASEERPPPLVRVKMHDIVDVNEEFLVYKYITLRLYRTKDRESVRKRQSVRKKGKMHEVGHARPRDKDRRRTGT